MQLLEKALHWGLAHSFRGLVQDRHGKRHGGRQAGMALEQKLKARMLLEKEGVGQPSETSKPKPSDIAHLAKPHLLILP